MTATFIESDCSIQHNGQSFTAGGAHICDCSDGYRRGVVYVRPEAKEVTDWHGNKLATANFGRVYQGNFSRMQAVTFIHDGITFHGRYCPDWSQALRVRSTKRVKG